MGQLTGKVALVTGAGRGIGEAIVHALAREGAAVALVARTRSEIDRVAKDVAATGARTFAVVADVSQEDDVNASVAAAVAALGEIDVLVNNAGIGVRGALAEMPVEEWRRIVDVNLLGPYLYARALVPGMVARRWGRVINVGSVMSKVGMPLFSAYAASKHGLVGFTRALALEVAEHGVTVNAVCPGVTKSPGNDELFEIRSRSLGVPVDKLKEDARNRIPMKSIAAADEVAPAVVFLASAGAARITGEAMNVSAGFVMH